MILASSRLTRFNSPPSSQKPPQLGQRSRLISVKPRNFTGAKSTFMQRGHFLVGGRVASSSCEQNSMLPSTFEGKLIQLSRVEPKTAAVLTSVVGQLSIPGSAQFLHEEFGALEHATFRGHIIIDHLNFTVQALHARSLLALVLHR